MQILQSPVSITDNLTPAGAAFAADMLQGSAGSGTESAGVRRQVTPLHCHSLPVINLNEFSSGSFKFKFCFQKSFFGYDRYEKDFILRVKVEM